MISERYKQVENVLMENRAYSDYLVQELATHLERPHASIEHALYLAGLSTGRSIAEIALVVHEFYLALEENEQEVQQASEEKHE